MSKPYKHAISSARKYGGVAEDYMEIHEFMDSSKMAIADNRHRALTHNSWFIGMVIPKVFGEVFRRASDGAKISSRDIAEQHVAEDYGGKFIPSAQDFIAEMEYKDWMQNGKGLPPSYAKIIKKVTKEEQVERDQSEEIEQLTRLKEQLEAQLEEPEIDEGCFGCPPQAFDGAYGKMQYYPADEPLFVDGSNVNVNEEDEYISVAEQIRNIQQNSDVGYQKLNTGHTGCSAAHLDGPHDLTEEEDKKIRASLFD